MVWLTLSVLQLTVFYKIHSFCSANYVLLLNLIKNIHKNFLWNNKCPKMNYSYSYSLISDYSKGGLKDIDVASKFKSLRMKWITKSLYDDNFHIPLHYLNEATFHLSSLKPGNFE